MIGQLMPVWSSIQISYLGNDACDNEVGGLERGQCIIRIGKAFLLSNEGDTSISFDDIEGACSNLLGGGCSEKY